MSMKTTEETSVDDPSLSADSTKVAAESDATKLVAENTTLVVFESDATKVVAENTTKVVAENTTKVVAEDTNDERDVPVATLNPSQDGLFLQNIDPPEDVDFFRLDLRGGDRVLFDIDDGYDEADGDFLDTILTVFNQNGDVVDLNNDSIMDPGSTSGLDSFIDFVAPTDGSYLVAVSSFPNFFNTETGDWSNTGDSTGEYVLSIQNVDDFLV
jgi:Bacterial pre-peptidase C-terminal domain